MDKNQRRKEGFQRLVFWGQKKEKQLWNCRKLPFVGFFQTQITKTQRKITKPPNHKKQTKKTPFCILANYPLFLVIFSTYTLLFLQICVLLKTLWNSVFSRAQLLCITDSKTPFRGPLPKWHFWNQKCHFGFSHVPAETPMFVVFGDFVWLKR